MKTNTKTRAAPIHTHEGAVAARINAEQQLRRTVMSCLLWEGEFYENGESIAARIGAGIAAVPPLVAANIAREARGPGSATVRSGPTSTGSRSASSPGSSRPNPPASRTGERPPMGVLLVNLTNKTPISRCYQTIK